MNKKIKENDFFGDFFNGDQNISLLGDGGTKKNHQKKPLKKTFKKINKGDNSSPLD